MNPIVYLVIRSILESESQKVSTFVLSCENALSALAKCREWRGVWKDCTITVERVQYLKSINQFSSYTIEQSELIKCAKEEIDKEIEQS